MNKGEIWLVNLPEWTGREQIGTRPALLMTETIAGLIILIPLTSNLKNLQYPYTIKFLPSIINGLSKESVALLFHIRSVDARRMIHKIGTLEERYVQETDRILKNILQL